MAVRAFWLLAPGRRRGGRLAWLFPAALGCLVASKAYGVTRAAAVPRLLPDELTLVKANARVSLAGILGATVSAPWRCWPSYFGPEWSLRYAFVLFVAGHRLGDPAARPGGLQRRRGRMRCGPAPAGPSARPGRPRIRIPRPVAFALRANCGPRWLSGS